jgi:hypothetical protein
MFWLRMAAFLFQIGTVSVQIGTVSVQIGMASVETGMVSVEMENVPFEIGAIAPHAKIIPFLSRSSNLPAPSLATPSKKLP